MKTLQHGDTVRLATWQAPYDITTATVGTSAGYAKEHGDSFTSDGAPWTSYTGTTLYGDRSAALAAQEKRRAACARSIELVDGEHVMIEGTRYSVRVVPGNARGPRNCDPIHFVPMPLCATCGERRPHGHSC